MVSRPDGGRQRAAGLAAYGLRAAGLAAYGLREEEQTAPAISRRENPSEDEPTEHGRATHVRDRDLTRAAGGLYYIYANGKLRC